MKMQNRLKGKKYLTLLLAAIIILTMGGCGSSKKAETESAMAVQDMTGTATAPAYDASAENYAPEEAMAESYDKSAVAAGNGAIDSETIAAAALGERKLIKTVNMNLETMEFDLFIEELTAQITAAEGYIESSDTSGRSYYSETSARYATVVARIPAKQLDAFLDQISEISNVTYKSEYLEDITLQYVDIETRKESLKIEQQRLLELLEKAEVLEDIIAIESRLSEVRYQIESYESNLRVYDNKVDYSTVSLSISEVERMTEVNDETAWEKIRTGFSNSLYRIATGFKNFGIWFVSSIPYFVIWAVILLLLFLVVKTVRKVLKKKSAKEKKKQEERAKQEAPAGTEAISTEASSEVSANAAHSAKSEDEIANEPKK